MRPVLEVERVDLETRYRCRERRVLGEVRRGEMPDDLAVRAVEQLAVGAVAISLRRELTGPMRRGLEVEVAGVEPTAPSPPSHLASVVVRPARAAFDLWPQ